MGDLEWQNSAVPVMPLDQVVGNPERSAQQFFRCLNFLPREAQQLRIGKIERRRVTDREIVTQPVLRERCAVSIRDLTARRGNVENVSARELLRFECRNDRPLQTAKRSNKLFRFWLTPGQSSRMLSSTRFFMSS